MPLMKSVTMPNGLTLNYHKITSYEGRGENLTINVASWRDEDHYKSGVPPVWNEPVTLLAPEDLLGNLNEALQEGGTFAGATAVNDALEGLEAVKLKAWARHKAMRDSKEYAPITTDKGQFDADADSQRRIIGAGVLALVEKIQWVTQAVQTLAASSNVTLSDIPTSETEWTRYDNSTVNLLPDDLLMIGHAMGLQIKQAHTQGRAVRNQIQQAQSSSEVQNVQWPSS